MSKLWKTPSSLMFLMLLLAACASGGPGSPLQASGTVETVRVVISSEIGGQIAELGIQAGERVQAGDILLRLDDALFAAHQAQAQAGLGAAQGQLAAAKAQDDAAEAAVAAAKANLNAADAQFDLARTGASLDGGENGNPWLANVPDAFVQPGWYFDQDEQIDAAQQLVDLASSDVQAALDALNELLREADYAGVDQAEEDLAQARAAYLLADQLRRKPVSGEHAQEVRTALREAFERAERDLTDAQDQLDGLTENEAAQALLDRRIALSVARERFQFALAGYYSMLTGDKSPVVQAAQAQVDAAQAAVTQAEAAAEAAGAGVSQAQQALDQAQAALDLVNAQINKLTLRAPMAGVVLTLASAQGEMLLPGTPALTLGKLDQLTITVYIPEDRYGEVSIGDQAQVSADSFPDRTFSAQVTRIADQAEYTPRNVQTKEERQTTVYAVELTLLEGLDQLKPGMPADVTFESK